MNPRRLTRADSSFQLSLTFRQFEGALQRGFRSGMIRLSPECFLELLCRLGITLLPGQGDSVVKSGIDRLGLQPHDFSKLREGLGEISDPRGFQREIEARLRKIGLRPDGGLIIGKSLGMPT